MEHKLARAASGKYWQLATVTQTVTESLGKTRDPVTGKWVSKGEVSFAIGRVRTVCTKRKALELTKREAFGDWDNRHPATDSDRIKAVSRSKLRIAEVPSDGIVVGGARFVPGDPNEGVTVIRKPKVKHSAGVSIRPMNGVWRRYNVNAKGGREYQADYASFEDAKACRNPIADHSNVDRSHVVVQKIEG